MSSSQPTRRITISLPENLVDYADEQARRLQTSRSQFIGRALAELQAAEEEALAVEGYRYYAQEACTFAEESAAATAEALRDER